MRSCSRRRTRVRASLTRKARRSFCAFDTTFFVSRPSIARHLRRGSWLQYFRRADVTGREFTARRLTSRSDGSRTAPRRPSVQLNKWQYRDKRIMSGKAGQTPLYDRPWFKWVSAVSALLVSLAFVGGLVFGAVKLAAGLFESDSRPAPSEVVQRLRPGMQIADFQSLLGKPQITSPGDQFGVYIFERHDFYVQALVRVGQVVVVSVTGRTKDFVPEFPQFRSCFSGTRGPPVTVDNTRFADLKETPHTIELIDGNAPHFYAEMFGGYHACNFQFFILSHNTFGYGSTLDGSILLDHLEGELYRSNAASAEAGLLPESDAVDLSRLWDAEPFLAPWLNGHPPPELVAVRRRLVINTYTETLPGIDARVYLFPFLTARPGELVFGPSQNDITTLSP
jgi:hypothetical protein